MDMVVHGCSETYPDVSVVATAHPVPFANGVISKVVTGVQMSFIGASLMGRRGFEQLNIVHLVPPAVLNVMEQNKFQNIMMAWFVGNFVQQNLCRTEAFEVHYDGELIWSKLETKRMPSYEMIVSGIDGIREKNGFHSGGQAPKEEEEEEEEEL